VLYRIKGGDVGLLDGMHDFSRPGSRKMSEAEAKTRECVAGRCAAALSWKPVCASRKAGASFSRHRSSGLALARPPNNLLNIMYVIEHPREAFKRGRNSGYCDHGGSRLADHFGPEYPSRSFRFYKDGLGLPRDPGPGVRHRRQDRQARRRRVLGRLLGLPHRPGRPPMEGRLGCVRLQRGRLPTRDLNPRPPILASTGRASYTGQKRNSVWYRRLSGSCTGESHHAPDLC
jgi:hypothetical protein